MRLPLFLTLAVTFLLSLASAAHPDRQIDIFAWPLTSPKSQTLARITYNSTHATVKSYTAPSIPAGDDTVRIGFYHANNPAVWSGVATAASNFDQGKTRRLQLLLNTEGEVYHVGFKASDLGTSSKTGQGRDGLDVEVVRMAKGPSPVLAKPIVTKDGQVEEKEPEKSFLQKYWWIIGGILLLQVVMGGAGKE